MKCSSLLLAWSRENLHLTINTRKFLLLSLVCYTSINIIIGLFTSSKCYRLLEKTYKQMKTKVIVLSILKIRNKNSWWLIYLWWYLKIYCYPIVCIINVHCYQLLPVITQIRGHLYSRSAVTRRNVAYYLPLDFIQTFLLWIF